MKDVRGRYRSNVNSPQSKNSMEGSGKKLTNDLWNGVKDGSERDKKWVKSNIGDKIISKIKSAVGGLWDIGKNWVQGIWNGIKDNLSILTNAGKKIATTPHKSAKKHSETRSPSKLYEKLVGHWIDGIDNGAQKGQSRLAAIGAGIANGVTPERSLMGNLANSFTQNFVSPMITAMRELNENLYMDTDRIRAGINNISFAVQRQQLNMGLNLLPQGAQAPNVMLRTPADAMRSQQDRHMEKETMVLLSRFLQRVMNGEKLFTSDVYLDSKMIYTQVNKYKKRVGIK